eukprot:m.163915 g.163915  ORF g.163915 m.163915 type:complete len:147 (-) comp9881_c2_seq1:367-807(-)
MPSIRVDPEYGYAVLVALANLVQHLYIQAWLTTYRRRNDIPEWMIYASLEDCKSERIAHVHNCGAAAFAGISARQPFFLAMMFFAAVKYPLIASIAGAVFVVGQLLYFLGFTSGSPPSRHIGAISYIALFILAVLDLVLCLRLLSF